MVLEISGFVADHSVAKDQILCPRRRSNGVSLYKFHALKGAFQRERIKEGVGDGVNAELLEGCHRCRRSSLQEPTLKCGAAVDLAQSKTT